MSGGADDRRRKGALRSVGDRPVHPVIRARRAELFDLNLKRIAVVTMVTDEHLPEIVMFEGEPFLRANREDVLGYVQVRAYRADTMVLEVCA